MHEGVKGADSDTALSSKTLFLFVVCDISDQVLNRSDAEETKPFEGLQSMIDAAEGPVSQVISNARGPFPQIGMISIPGPFSPAHRHVSFRDGVDDFRSRAVKRICKQLADVRRQQSLHSSWYLIIGL